MDFKKVQNVIFPKTGDRKKYDDVSRGYHLIMGVFEIIPNLEAIKLADIRKGEKILDMAFGTGWVLERLISKVDGGTVYGIDFSPKMHNVTWERLKKTGLEDKAALVLGNVLDMPYKENTFDVVFGSFILDLLKEKDMPVLLQEIRRVLKPDGRCVLTTMTKEGEGLLKAGRYLYEIVYPFWPTVLGYRPSSRPIYLSPLVEKNGFRITRRKITRTKMFPFPVEIVVGKVSEK